MHLLQPTRRDLLRLSAGSLLAAGLWPGALPAEDQPPGKDFTFIVVNDTHYIDRGCDEWLTKVFKQMKAQTPDFCLLVGDVTDGGTESQNAAMRDHIKASGLAVYTVVGNHDYLLQDNRKRYEEYFPERINYRFAQHGWQFIGLDSTEGQKYKATEIQPATFTWLDEQLPKLDKKLPTILFTHFPLAPAVRMQPLNGEKLLERFKEHNLRAVYNGHYHAFTEKKFHDAPVTTNRCCAFKTPNHDSSTEKGYFLCTIKDGKLERTFVEVKPL